MPKPYATEEERNEAHKAAKRRWFERNREKVMAAAAEWARANPDKVAEKTRRSYWKKLGAETGFAGAPRGAAISPDAIREERAAKQRQRRAVNPELRQRERERGKAYYEQNKETVRARAREQANEGRRKALELYGNACCRCGFSDFRALHFDHVKGDGWEDRKSGAGNPVTRYRIICEQVGNGVYQLLCANCNWIKAYDEGEFYKRRHVNG